MMTCQQFANQCNPGCMTQQSIEIVEVSPRDGLQNERTILSTGDKIALVERALAAGLRRMEVASFVNPARVPQMADAEAVLEGLRGLPGLRRIGLVLNRRGLDRALRAGVDEVNFVVVASETFSQRNQGASVAQTIATWEEVAVITKAEQVGLSATIGTAFGCPFEGEVPAPHVAGLVARVAAHAPDEIALADTVGVGAPSDVTERFAAAAAAAPGIRLRAHFHNTRNTGYANAYAAIQAGVRVLDASIGGIGGCPFAPAATGNIATEDLLYMLARMGVAPDINLTGLIDTACWLEGKLGHPYPAMLGRAGLFPPA
jgi:hydroxymethylglutaryl-CoA lyase